MAKRTKRVSKKKAAPASAPVAALSEADFAKVRSHILRSVVSELRVRGGDFAYGYTKSSNENYGKYEKE